MVNTNKNADYIVYTDGGCQVNPGGAGAYAAVLIDTKTGEISEYTGGFVSTTNNRMEVMAVITALQHLPRECSVELYSDSQYVIKTIAGKYAKKKNQDLWEKLDKEMEGKHIHLNWVRGHNGNLYNEKCDTMCTSTMENKSILQMDEGYKAQNIKKSSSKKKTKASKGAMNIKIRVLDKFATQEFTGTNIVEYAEVFQISISCAKSILEFKKKKQHSFKDYVALKTGGLDFWSRKKKEQLLSDNESGSQLWNTILQYLPEEKEALSALRWYMRGLSLEEAIRKELVQKEVSGNCKYHS